MKQDHPVDRQGQQHEAKTCSIHQTNPNACIWLTQRENYHQDNIFDVKKDDERNCFDGFIFDGVDLTLPGTALFIVGLMHAEL